MKPTTTTEAEARGLRVLAGPYAPGEFDMLDAARRQLGNIEHAIIETKHGLEIWRTVFGFREASKNKDTSK